jgi:hypothetical protein
MFTPPARRLGEDLLVMTTADLMYQRQLRHAGHTRRFEINESGGAWTVRALVDAHVVKHARYDDWHRVERARWAFDREVVSLQDAGWVAD